MKNLCITLISLTCATLPGVTWADLALATSKNCMACHALEKRIVGPAYKDVAAKYAGDKTAVDRLATKIQKGGGGVWGPIAPLLNTVIQKLVAANLRGRVFALEMMMWNVAPLTSFIVVGICLDSFGVRPVYLTLALVMAGASVVLLTARRLKELNAIDG